MSSSPLPTVGVMDSTQQDARSLKAGVEEDEVKEPQMGIQMTIVLLIVVAAVCRSPISLTVLTSDRAE